MINIEVLSLIARRQLGAPDLIDAEVHDVLHWKVIASVIMRVDNTSINSNR